MRICYLIGDFDHVRICPFHRPRPNNLVEYGPRPPNMPKIVSTGYTLGTTILAHFNTEFPIGNHLFCSILIIFLVLVVLVDMPILLRKNGNIGHMGASPLGPLGPRPKGGYAHLAYYADLAPASPSPFGVGGRGPLPQKSRAPFGHRPFGGKPPWSYGLGPLGLRPRRPFGHRPFGGCPTIDWALGQ